MKQRSGLGEMQRQLDRGNALAISTDVVFSKG